MLRNALQYLKMGWSILPIKPNSKEPLIDWKDYQKRKLTEEELKKWFSITPTPNIGIVTGSVSNLCVLDVDGNNGLNFLQQNRLVSSVIAISGKGRHLYYQWTEGIRNSASKIAENVDIRGEGGYILAPPSIHPNGKRYLWLSQRFGKLQAFPQEILKESGVNANAAGITTKSKEPDWIAKALGGMKIGNIDNTLTSILGRMRYDGWSANDALVLLRPHADKAGATEGHLEDKIKNVYGHYQSKKSIIIDTTEETEGIEQFLGKEEKVEWIIPNLIAKKSIGFCVGLPESAKTWLMMDLAISVASGMEWISLFLTEKHRTLFIEQERFRGETQRRFKALLSAKGLSGSDVSNLTVKCDSHIKIDLEQSYNAFDRLLEKLKPELVIIDSLATIHTKEENNRMEIQSVMEKFKTLREKHGCSFLFISHPSKFEFQAAKEGQEPNIGTMAGSIAIPAVAETVFFVRKLAGGGSMVYHVKSTLSQKQKQFGITVEDVPNGIQVRGIH